MTVRKGGSYVTKDGKRERREWTKPAEPSAAESGADTEAKGGSRSPLITGPVTGKPSKKER